MRKFERFEGVERFERFEGFERFERFERFEGFERFELLFFLSVSHFLAIKVCTLQIITYFCRQRENIK